MTSTTIERARQQLEKLDQLTPEETNAKIAALPAQMTYEARYALQQVKETVDPQQLVEVIEPLARAIGWAEALVFTCDTTKEREILRSISMGTFAK